MNRKKLTYIIAAVCAVVVIAVILVFASSDSSNFKCDYKYKISIKDDTATVKLYKGKDTDCEWYISYGEKEKVKLDKQAGEKYDIFTLSINQDYMDTPVFKLKREKDTVYAIGALVYADESGISEFVFTGVQTQTETVEYKDGEKLPFTAKNTSNGSMTVTVKSKNSLYYECDDGIVMYLDDCYKTKSVYVVRLTDNESHQIRISDTAEKINKTLVITVGLNKDGALYVVDSHEVEFEPSEQYLKERTLYGNATTEKTEETTAETGKKSTKKKSENSSNT